jgi:hypothetical protein
MSMRRPLIRNKHNSKKNEYAELHSAYDLECWLLITLLKAETSTCNPSCFSTFSPKSLCCSPFFSRHCPWQMNRKWEKMCIVSRSLFCVGTDSVAVSRRLVTQRHADVKAKITRLSHLSSFFTKHIVYWHLLTSILPLSTVEVKLLNNVFPREKSLSWNLWSMFPDLLTKTGQAWRWFLSFLVLSLTHVLLFESDKQHKLSRKPFITKHKLHTGM